MDRQEMGYVFKRNLGRLLGLIILVLISPFLSANSEDAAHASSESSFWAQMLEPSVFAIWASTLLAAFVAFLMVLQTRTGRRKQAAFEMLYTARRDTKLEKAYRTVRLLHTDSTVEIEKLAYPDKGNGEDAEIRKAQSKDIQYVLNHFEHVCAGIQMGVLCEDTVKRCQCGTIREVYNMCKPLIIKARQISDRETIYMELERVATDWSDKPLTKKDQSKKTKPWNITS